MLVLCSTLKKGDHISSPCLVREIHLQRLPKGAALDLCRRTVTPLSWCESTEVVKIMQMEFSDEMGEEEDPGLSSKGDKLYFVTDIFYDSIQGLASYHNYTN